MLAPSTAFGREVAGRAAAATGSGLVGDAIALSARDGLLVAAKPAFAGALVADITCRSTTQMVTVRPGVLPSAPRPAARRPRADACGRPAGPGPGAVRPARRRRGDAGPGGGRDRRGNRGARPRSTRSSARWPRSSGAELAATRKVTDRGWAPRARQVGITGRSIAPRLYVAVGLSGKFNHMVGVRAAGPSWPSTPTGPRRCSSTATSASWATGTRSCPGSTGPCAGPSPRRSGATVS